MKEFEVKGKYLEKENKKKFSKKIKSLSEKTAKEKTYALIGSKHKVKRRHIEIEEIKEAK